MPRRSGAPERHAEDLEGVRALLSGGDDRDVLAAGHRASLDAERPGLASPTERPVARDPGAHHSGDRLDAAHQLLEEDGHVLPVRALGPAQGDVGGEEVIRPHARLHPLQQEERAEQEARPAFTPEPPERPPSFSDSMMRGWMSPRVDSRRVVTLAVVPLFSGYWLARRVAIPTISALASSLDAPGRSRPTVCRSGCCDGSAGHES